MTTRREFLRHAGYALTALGAAPLSTAFATSGVHGPSASSHPATQTTLRCINVVNFIRMIEPRFAMDMMLPVREQMALIRTHKLPATWLLQFDALVDGPFVPFLKQHMADDHEAGFWFEMNEKLCAAAGVDWRGRAGYEWDPDPTVAFTIGYTPAERIRLADTAMRTFKSIWGRHPRSIGSWNLDAHVLQHLSDHYNVSAYAVCRDQIATDGFTIWGAPIAGYYPSKRNCWSPALARQNQIDTPVFRMLGQDPVYYYDKDWTLPDGRTLHEPDTMEPVWTSGKSTAFVNRFLDMIASAPSLRFAYAQMGQENTFPWPRQADAYPMQMKALAELRDHGGVHVETMETSGRRFRKRFTTTPAQAQVQLQDPFGNKQPARNSIWYQSRFYRANLHLDGDLPYLRDLTVYSDKFAQPFLDQPTREHWVQQRMPALLDGYHWSPHPVPADGSGAGGFFTLSGKRLKLTGKPSVHEDGDSLIVDLPVGNGRTLRLRFDEQQMSCHLQPAENAALALSFAWDPAKATLTGVSDHEAHYQWQGFDYSARVTHGTARATNRGWVVEGTAQGIALMLAQPT